MAEAEPPTIREKRPPAPDASGESRAAASAEFGGSHRQGPPGRAGHCSRKDALPPARTDSSVEGHPLRAMRTSRGSTSIGDAWSDRKGPKTLRYRVLHEDVMK